MASSEPDWAVYSKNLSQKKANVSKFMPVVIQMMMGS
jgi:hypothetical protein